MAVSTVVVVLVTATMMAAATAVMFVASAMMLAASTASTSEAGTPSIAITVSAITRMVVAIARAIVGVVVAGVIRTGCRPVVDASYRADQNRKQTYRQNSFHRSSPGPYRI